ncbi:MAG: hypothetical protein JW993_13335 [Sedimentisphaerales bacterium]|nr:hypothetical protein [Sedimentisphaerales bacterium]
MPTYIVTVLGYVMAAAVTIYTIRLQRVIRERWWEHKLAAYIRIIDALSALVYYYEEHYDAEVEGRDFSDIRDKEMADHWRKNYTDLKRATAVGAFLISPAAAESLDRMWKDRPKGANPNDRFTIIESQYVTARDCLRAVIEAARVDLRVGLGKSYL